MSAVIDERPVDLSTDVEAAAFDDPTGAPDAPPRRSIEIRALVFW
jgi:hypothetical protein